MSPRPTVPPSPRPQQMSLDDLAALEEPDLEALLTTGHRGASIEARFRVFHVEHPEVYDELAKMARELRGLGHPRLGIRMLWEVVRWRTMLGAIGQAREADGFKLNDHFPSRYARLIMAREADLAGIFETRELRAR